MSELVLFGPVTLTTPALGALLREEIPVTYASSGGWVLGHTVSTGHKNVSVRIAQYRAAFDERKSLMLARSLVAAKIRNSRVFLRRNFKAGDEAARDAAIEAMARLADRALTRRPRRSCLASRARRRPVTFACSSRCSARPRGLSGIRLREAHAPAAGRSSQRHAVARLCDARPDLAHRALGGRLRPYLGFYHSRASAGRRWRST